MWVLFSFYVLVRLCNIPPSFKRYVMKFSRFLGYPKKVNARALNSFGHEQYPTDSLNQNNLAHGVYKIPK